jgi:CBS domain containing-hemolysin-like protein
MTWGWKDTLYVCLLLVLLAISAIYSAADMAYSSVNKLRLEKRALRGEKRSERAYKYAKNFDATISTVLFGNDFANVLASSLMALLGADIWSASLGEEAAATLASLILLFVLLVFGEIVPKALAKAHSFGLSRLLTGFVRLSSIVFFPFVKPANKFAEWIASPLIEKAPKESALASDDELEAMVDDIENEGVIDEDQSELLHRSIRFKETTCYEIMTPRNKVKGYDIETSFDAFLAEPDAFRHSRIPVYKGSFDHVLGYIPVKSLLRVLVQGLKPSLEDLIMPIVNVPHTMEISSAMALLKESHRHIAVVRDEFGGVEGILTLEDILEELVGEMWDETDVVKADFVQTDKRNVYLVKGSMGIDEFFVKFKLNEDRIDEDYTTVSGWVNDRLRRFAKVGDHFQEGRIDLKVTAVSEYTVKEVEVVYHPRRKIP